MRAFGAQRAVDAISFDVNPGELVALVGASGSGKTTTLRIVAGYEQPNSGRVLFDGRDITRVAPSKRDFGMVFQHYALFPHMSVTDNVAFGLEARGIARAERRRTATAALDNVGLTGKGDRMVQQLSGGEQQRVALARAVVIQPRLLLLDEPLSNLDPALRQSTRDELRSALKQSGAPALFVTHDQDDAFAVADRIVLLSNGRVLQIGAPEELYARPASREVAEFIGHAAIVPARLADGHAVVEIGGSTRQLEISTGNPSANGDGEAVVVLRPEALELVSGECGDGWPACISSRRFAGATFMYTIQLDGAFAVEVASAERLEVGGRVCVRVVLPVPVVS